MVMCRQTVQRYGGFPIPAIVVRDAGEALPGGYTRQPLSVHSTYSRVKVIIIQRFPGQYRLLFVVLPRERLVCSYLNTAAGRMDVLISLIAYAESPG